MNRKAVFFTFLALFFVILIFAIASLSESYRYREKSNAIASRVKTMQWFISDFEDDFNREIFIGGYRSLISMNTYVRMIESNVEDFDSVFTEILLNGTANGTQMELMQQKTQGADIESWLERVNEESTKLNIKTSLVVHSVQVVQISPWDVAIVLNATVNISDSKGLAEWVYTKTYTRNLSILGLEDPLYTVGTNDRITNLINYTAYLDFVNDTNNDTTMLQEHVDNSFYIASNTSPSYIMRFYGNLSASPYGIESFVNIQKFSIQNLEIKKISVIDYLYFSNGTTIDYCNITDLPEWVRIDADHLETYEIDKLNYTSC